MKHNTPLLSGESPIENAPTIELDNGSRCIPQHYLKYSHTRESIENIILDIQYSAKYPIFVSEDKASIYLQVGVIGYDNYAALNSKQDLKIVYGRKWRVESQLPSSEVIQTAFLALQKAREHEIRELFRFTQNGRTTTPFNNHHDLPLMANNAELFTEHECAVGSKPSSTGAIKQDVQEWLKPIRYDQCKLQLVNLTKLSSNRWLIDLSFLGTHKSTLDELTNAHNISIILPDLSANTLYYALMDECIRLSNTHVEEGFRYRGFARFSRKNPLINIAKLSSTLRKFDSDKQERKALIFSENFTKNNYETDKTRVPELYPGGLRERIQQQLSEYHITEGLLPEF